jgi:hypothetical protein
MKIPVRYEPNCTWVLEDGVFCCTHDEVEVVEYTNMYMTNDGPEEYTSEGYECVECGEQLEGTPAEDREYND